jgi:putative flippase GtrA
MIEKLKKFAVAHKEALLYLLFGALTTLVSILTFAIFNQLLGDERYLLSNLISWVIAVVFAFFTNKHLVFASKKNDKKTLLSEGGKFLGARVLSLGLEELILWMMLDVMGLSGFALAFLDGEIISKTVATVFVVVANYFFSKFVIFKKK